MEYGSIVLPLAGGKVPPEEIELIPAGVLETRPMDGRPPYLNDRPHDVVAATARNGLDLPVDYDHQTLFAEENGQPAPASGWVSETFVRDGAVWGKVRWTERAAAMIMAEEYRYISPVFAHTQDATRRVLRVDQAALTNEPAFFMRALARAAARAKRDEDGMDIKDLLKALGIPETSTDEEIRTAATAMVAASAAGAVALSALGVEATATEAEIRTAASARIGDGVPRAEYDRVVADNAALKAQRADEIATAEVDAAVAEGKLAPAQKEWGLAYAKADPEGFRAFAKAAPKIVDPGGRTAPPETTAPPVAGAPPGWTVDEDRAALHARAMARASRDNIPYVRAVALEAQEQ